MSEIFLSYIPSDRETAKRLAERLKEMGWSVFWDRVIAPGTNYDSTLGKALEKAKCVILLRSANSFRSHLVRSEVASAAHRGILVPAILEADVAHREQFEYVKAAHLQGWDGTAEHPAFVELLSGVLRLLNYPADAATKADLERRDKESLIARVENQGFSRRGPTARLFTNKKIPDVRVHLLADGVALEKRASGGWESEQSFQFNEESALAKALTERSAESVPKAHRIFVSYSHEDTAIWEELRKMLAPLEPHTIELWDDKRIPPGKRWKQEIEAALKGVQTAILLVSSAYLASEFIKEHELPSLLEEARKGGLTILWIHVSASLYNETPISSYQALHDIKTPLDTLAGPARAVVLAAIGGGIVRVIRGEEGANAADSQ